MSWNVFKDDADDIVISKEHRGVKTLFKIEKAFYDYPEISSLSNIANNINQYFAENITIIKQDDTRNAHGPVQLASIIQEIGQKGISVQRFKGLGEMNAEQLWETTLDPSNRTLLQVKVEEFDEADETFSTLMGNVVEPRREFIQENALKVVNLDV